MTAILALPLIIFFFAASDIWNGYRWRKHDNRCPCPYGPYACDRGHRS